MKKVAARLRHSEEQLRLVLTASGIQGWTLDIGRNELTWVTPAGDSERVSQSLGDFLNVVHPDDRMVVQNAFDRSVHDGDEYYAEFRVTEGGKEQWWLGRGTVITARSGQLTLIAGINTNITDRKRAEEALRQAKDELERRAAERTAELRKSETHLRKLSLELIKAQENERKRIAHEIHDSIGGSLAAAKFRLETDLSEIKDNDPQTRAALEDVIPIIAGTIEECRRIQMALRPSVLDDLGIQATIKWFCRQFESTYGDILVRNEVDLGEEELPDYIQVAIYRVLQEAMNNVAKHGVATEVLLSLQRTDQAINLVIRDNGKGFDPSETHSSEDAPRGLGLDSMRERTEHSGGFFSIESSNGAGTTIRASWPIDYWRPWIGD